MITDTSKERKAYYTDAKTAALPGLNPAFLAEGLQRLALQGLGGKDQLDVAGPCSYTHGIIQGLPMSYMKTAISIDEDLFRKAEKLSSKLQVSRSQLFAQALEYLIERSETLEVIQRLNEVYGQKLPDDEVVAKAGKRKMRKVIDKW